MPETATASSDVFVFPTNCTPLWRAIPKHFASPFAGGLCLARNSEPAVVTTPFMSIKSLTASRNFLLSFEGGQYSMNARSTVGLFGRGFGIVQPVSQFMARIAGKIVRISADSTVAPRKNRLNNPDMMLRTKQHTGQGCQQKLAISGVGCGLESYLPVQVRAASRIMTLVSCAGINNRNSVPSGSERTSSRPPPCAFASSDASDNPNPC